MSETKPITTATNETEMVSVERAELERLRGIEALALRRWGEFSDVVTTVEGETIRMHVAGFIAQDLAAMFIDMAENIGAKNYVELTFSEPGASRARIVVTVQRTDGKTPNELKVEAERRATDAEVMLTMMQRRAEAAEREAERLRHGEPVEGDFVCPNDLRAHDLEQDRDAWQQFGQEANARAVALRRAVIAARQRAQQAEIERDTALPLVDAARAVREAHAAVGGDEGIERAAPELVEACALVSSIASTHDNPWVREVWTTTHALTAAALEDPTCAT